MLFNCDNCDYQTTRKYNLDLHYKRLTPCKLTKQKKNTSTDVKIECIIDPSKIMDDPSKIMDDPSKIMDDPSKIMDDPSKIMDDPSFQCSKCNKLFTRKDNIKKHEKKCDGYDKKQCKICLRMFVTAQGKHEHIKYVKCKPPASTSSSTINNINNIQNNDNRVTNNIQNIIIRLEFGKENIEKLLEELDYDKVMKKIVVKGNVGYVDAFDKIYFNSDHPENQTIKKVRKKENLVDIYKGNGIWEKQFTDVAFGILNKNIEKYHRNYFQTIPKDIKKINYGLYYKIVKYAKEMIELGWDCQDIEDAIQEEGKFDREKLKIRKIQNMTNMIMEHIYQKTKNK
jgi:hypothetical protein